LDSNLADEQAGFRPHRSCEDQITGLAQSIYDAAESASRKRTALACFDFAKAFDSVPRHRLDRSILQSKIPAYAARFLHEFLADRRVQVKFGGRSNWTKVTNGLPQGTVTSPILFTTFINPLIRAAKDADTQVSMFADDICVWTQDNELTTTETKLQAAVDRVARFADQNGLTLSVPKCSVTIFTLNPHESKSTLTITLRGQQLPNNPTPKFLGVIFDRLLSFRPHAAELKKKLEKRIQAVKALSGTDFGQGESTLRNLARSTVMSTAEYGSSTCTTFGNDKAVDDIQRMVNRTARVITGCVKSTPIGPLLAEAKLPLIRLRGREKGAIQLERAARTSNNPLRRYTHDHKSTRRITRPNFADEIHSLTEETGLNQYERESFPIQANRAYGHLPVSFHRAALPKQHTDQERREHAEQFLSKLPHMEAEAWTDGSATNGTEYGGSGGTVYAANGEIISFAVPAGRYCSSFRAEMVAIDEALTLFAQTPSHGSLRLCTDSLSAITQLEQRTPQCKVSCNIWNTLSNLDTVQMVHVPAHVGLERNEEADSQAAAAAKKPQLPTPIDISSATAAIKRHVKTRYVTALQAIKSNTTKKKEEQSSTIYFKHALTGPIDHLPRYQQVAVRRMRTGHSLHLAEYQQRIGKIDAPTCANCKVATDTQIHLLHDCPALQSARSCREVWDPGGMAAFLIEAGRIAPLEDD
jgi:ribonuclease HI